MLQGEPRLLLFSPDSRNLYFTTTLNPSVQAYCISTGELLPSPQIHVSPPNVLAISKDGNVLLSASPTPPVVLLQDLRPGGAVPTNFQPTDARSPVACACFHTCDYPLHSPYLLFLLGFQDGTLALYRILLSKLPRPYANSHLYRAQTSQLQPIKVGSIRKLHKAVMGGITAAEFIPGYNSRVVSIGHDGRCRLVDFENGGRVLRT